MFVIAGVCPCLMCDSPYYIWLGRPRSCDVSKACHAFEVEGGNMIGNCSPVPFKTIKDAEGIPPLDIGESQLGSSRTMVSIDITPPLSSFHYHVKSVGTYLFSLKVAEAFDSRGDSHTMSILCTRGLGPLFIHLLGCVGCWSGLQYF